MKKLKKCRICGKMKYERDDFPSDNVLQKILKQQPKQPYCLKGQCHHCCNTARFRTRWIMRRYGLTWKHYVEIFEKQRGKCLICEKDIFLQPTDDGDKTVHIDHNHSTGEIRGLLCYNCNSGLGCFRDNPEVLVKAAKYILSFRGCLK